MANFDPHINPQSGAWDDNYYNFVGKYSSGPSGNSGADAIYAENATAVNKYIDSLISQAQGKRDLIIKQLDAQHKLAVGSDDAAKAKFLETVSDALEQKIGRIPYDYQKYNERELESYANSSKNISDNRGMALKKLENDEKISLQQVDQQQKTGNRSLSENLNQRGLLEGQTPENVDAPASIEGLDGLAGFEANKQNTSFGIQRGAITGSADIGREGINLSAGQAQRGLDITHQNTSADLKTDARRAVQDESLGYDFGKQGADFEFKSSMDALQRQRDQLLRQTRLLSGSVAGINSGILGY